MSVPCQQTCHVNQVPLIHPIKKKKYVVSKCFMLYHFLYCYVLVGVLEHFGESIQYIGTSLIQKSLLKLVLLIQLDFQFFECSGSYYDSSFSNLNFFGAHIVPLDSSTCYIPTKIWTNLLSIRNIAARI
jgi:hypothetical protein